jgi:hypothetical protein
MRDDEAESGLIKGIKKIVWSRKWMEALESIKARSERSILVVEQFPSQGDPGLNNAILPMDPTVTLLSSVLFIPVPRQIINYK